MRSLIVEDEASSRILLEKVLSKYGATKTCENGREGQKALQEAMEAGNPYDLVCVDVMMPEMNGQELLAWFRGYEVTQGISPHEGSKVIMTTALDDAKNIMTSFREQCDAYIVKPVNPEMLEVELKSLKLL